MKINYKKTKKGLSGMAFISIVGILISIAISLFSFGGGPSIVANGANLNKSKGQILTDIDGLTQLISEYNRLMGSYPTYLATPFKVTGLGNLNAFSDKIRLDDYVTKWKTTDSDTLGTWFISEKVQIKYRTFTDSSTGNKSYKFFMKIPNTFSTDAVVKTTLGTDLCTELKNKYGSTRVRCNSDYITSNAVFTSNTEINETTENTFTSTDFIIVFNVVDTL